MATALKHSEPRPLPAPNSDFYQFAELLSDEERKVLADVRTFTKRNTQ
jgi:glutaryl-CoA dehydrogenase